MRRAGSNLLFACALTVVGCADVGADRWSLDRGAAPAASRLGTPANEIHVEVLETTVVEGSWAGAPGLHTRFVLRSLGQGAAPREFVAEMPGGVLGNRARVLSWHALPRRGDHAIVTLRGDFVESVRVDGPRGGLPRPPPRTETP